MLQQIERYAKLASGYDAKATYEFKEDTEYLKLTYSEGDLEASSYVSAKLDLHTIQKWIDHNAWAVGYDLDGTRVRRQAERNLIAKLEDAVKQHEQKWNTEGEA